MCAKHLRAEPAGRIGYPYAGRGRGGREGRFIIVTVLKIDSEITGSDR